jgi:RND family efflux transporter MFP subunit
MKGSKFRHLLIVVVGALIVGGAVWVIRDGRGWQWLTTRALAFFGQHEFDASAQSAASSPAGPIVESRGDVTIDARRQQLLGMGTATVQRRSLSRTIRTVGAVRADERRLVDVNVRVDGWIRDLQVDYTGRFVRQGDPLLTLYSPDLVATENEYLLALKAREEVADSTVPDAREYADRLVSSARRRLELWNVDASHIDGVRERGEAQGTVVFKSPASGFVVEKQAVQGMHVQAGQSLYRLADLSVVWVDASVYESDLPFVRVGQRATTSFDAYPGQSVSSGVIYIAPALDEATRTAQVRLELPNPQGRIKLGMYATITLEAPAQDALTVPPDATLDSGTQQFVFVTRGDGRYEPRAVKIGVRTADAVQILTGVSEGEQVASSALFLIDSESQLRAALRGFEAASPAPPSSPASVQAAVQVDFRTIPDPPQTGENTFEVTVKEAQGRPIDDASVTVTLYMPAMPSMSMPAMRHQVSLRRASSGTYRGSGEIMTPGRWEVTVTATRGGQTLATRQLAIVAR